jgi:hypothetical protein
MNRTTTHATRVSHSRAYIRYPVADHNVPTLGLMLAFCEYTEQWMHQHQENVISVHCRGGTLLSAPSKWTSSTTCGPAAQTHARLRFIWCDRQGQVGDDDLRVAGLFGHLCDR